LLKIKYKEILFYFIVYILIFLVLEFSIRVFLLTEKVRCDDDENQTYGYCPNYVGEMDVSDETGLEYSKVEIFTDKNGARQKNLEESVTPDEASIFFIGDSFIQAKKVPYEKTLYGILNKKNIPSYALGFSSWNPIQYLKAIKKIAKKDSKYYVFLFANDFMPSYDRSVINEMNYGYRPKADLVTNEDGTTVLVEESLLKKILKSSKLITFTYDRVKILLSKRKKDNENSWDRFHSGRKVSKANYSKEKFKECTNINFTGSLLSDYLAFSKHSDCWDKDFKESVLAGVKIVKEIYRYTKEDLNSEAYFYLIPPGWSFPHQNTFGRLTEDYGFPNDISVSQFGLLKFLENNQIAVVDIEEKILNEINKCNNCDDKFYFEKDGHWTPVTHEIVSKLVLESIN